MPFTVKLKTPIHGVSRSFALTGESISPEVAGFYYTYDGPRFTDLLDEFSRFFLNPVFERGVRPQQVDHVLIFLDKENEATVYCNELGFLLGCRPKHDVKEGDSISLNSMADIETLQPTLAQSSPNAPLPLPVDCGVIFVFSIGWLRGLYFNFTPLQDPTCVIENLADDFAFAYKRVAFPEKHCFTEPQWQKLFESGWFPFTCLSTHELATLSRMHDHGRYENDFMLPACNRFKSILPERLVAWKTNKGMADFGPFIEAALSSHQQSNYISCITTLAPVIEGIMRKLIFAEKNVKKPKQAPMVENLVARRPSRSLLLPERFKAYLTDSFFADFDLATGKLPLSRHSMVHGVSKAEDYDFFRATISFMVLDQMFYYLA
jgi:hypothetical protein